MICFKIILSLELSDAVFIANTISAHCCKIFGFQHHRFTIMRVNGNYSTLPTEFSTTHGQKKMLFIPCFWVFGDFSTEMCGKCGKLRICEMLLFALFFIQLWTCPWQTAVCLFLLFRHISIKFTKAEKAL